MVLARTCEGWKEGRRDVHRPRNASRRSHSCTAHRPPFMLTNVADIATPGRHQQEDDCEHISAGWRVGDAGKHGGGVYRQTTPWLRSHPPRAACAARLRALGHFCEKSPPEFGWPRLKRAGSRCFEGLRLDNCASFLLWRQMWFHISSHYSVIRSGIDATAHFFLNRLVSSYRTWNYATASSRRQR